MGSVLAGLAGLTEYETEREAELCLHRAISQERGQKHSAWKNGCKKLEFLGSSCIYPRMAPQPMKENCLLTSELEKTNEAYALEESYGYLTGSYVRDKDGVNGACMICEMFSYYATKGIGLLDKLDELYRMYGYCLNTLHSYEFDGSAGFVKMQKIMKSFRGDIEKFGNKKVLKLLDYAAGLDGLPKSDVLKFLLEDNCSIVIRPSGTEPKLKMYISVSAEDKETAEKTEEEICRSAEEYLNVPKMDIRNPR